jgi:hypothetical protein
MAQGSVREVTHNIRDPLRHNGTQPPLRHRQGRSRQRRSHQGRGQPGGDRKGGTGDDGRDERAGHGGCDRQGEDARGFHAPQTRWAIAHTAPPSNAAAGSGRRVEAFAGTLRPAAHGRLRRTSHNPPHSRALPAPIHICACEPHSCALPARHLCLGKGRRGFVSTRDQHRSRRDGPRSAAHRRSSRTPAAGLPARLVGAAEPAGRALPLPHPSRRAGAPGQRHRAGGADPGHRTLARTRTRPTPRNRSRAGRFIAGRCSPLAPGTALPPHPPPPAAAGQKPPPRSLAAPQA